MLHRKKSYVTTHSDWNPLSILTNRTIFNILAIRITCSTRKSLLQVVGAKIKVSMMLMITNEKSNTFQASWEIYVFIFSKLQLYRSW